jgi:hypothetical protein
MKRNTIKTLVLVALVLVFAIAFVSPSEAEKKIKPIVLEGTYGVTGQDICVGHWTQVPEGGHDAYWTKTATLQGTATFHADGTGTAEIDDISIIHPIYTPIPYAPYYGFNGGYQAGPFPIYINSRNWSTPQTDLQIGSASYIHITTSFTYEIDPLTRAITRTVGPSTGTFAPGSNLAGKTTTSSVFHTLGFVSLDTQTIIAATPIYNPSSPSDLENLVMTTTIRNADGNIYGVQEQICQRIRNAVLIK